MTKDALFIPRSNSTKSLDPAPKGHPDFFRKSLTLSSYSTVTIPAGGLLAKHKNVLALVPYDGLQEFYDNRYHTDDLWLSTSYNTNPNLTQDERDKSFAEWAKRASKIKPIWEKDENFVWPEPRRKMPLADMSDWDAEHGVTAEPGSDEALAESNEVPDQAADME
ncbi:hypothetical protein FDK38_002303 [Candidozyma auris]|nr:hypothetical protein FDK38_002303 [[Candida] auris]